MHFTEIEFLLDRYQEVNMLVKILEYLQVHPAQLYLWEKNKIHNLLYAIF